MKQSLCIFSKYTNGATCCEISCLRCLLERGINRPLLRLKAYPYHPPVFETCLEGTKYRIKIMLTTRRTTTIDDFPSPTKH